LLDLLRDLTAHKGYANAAFLSAIRRHGTAAGDPDILSLMQHVLLANRFWLLACLGQPFVLEEESRALTSLHDLIIRYRRTQDQEEAWLAAAAEADLLRRLEHPLIPGGTCLVSQALVQVYMHSHGHRAQCARLLRSVDGEPPTTDFIIWLANRRSAEWPATSPGGSETVP
jgi:uncharacterized damage-inducible protein DinB